MLKQSLFDSLSVEPLIHISESLPVGRVTAPQFVVMVLREAIITGVLPGGSPLLQDEIASQLKTSKVPVREALRELEGLGLVKFAPNIGFSVKPESANEMLECFELRTVLEPLAVRHSLPKATTQHLDEIEKIIDDFDAVDNPSVNSQWNLKLHLAFYAPANMSHLENMIVRAHTIAQRYAHIYMRLKSEDAPGQDEHRALLQAYRDKDVVLAERLMREHIDVASSDYAEFLQEYFKKSL